MDRCENVLFNKSCAFQQRQWFYHIPISNNQHYLKNSKKLSPNGSTRFDIERTNKNFLKMPNIKKRKRFSIHRYAMCEMDDVVNVSCTYHTIPSHFFSACYSMIVVAFIFASTHKFQLDFFWLRCVVVNEEAWYIVCAT